jgi:hypothetical protein
MHQRLSFRRVLLFLAPLLTLPLLVLGLTSAPASAANVVNVTFHVPAQPTINPCFPGDVVNLSGDIHIVITSTANNGGGYHMTDSLNSTLSGASITTGTKYVNSENQNDTWDGQAPFPYTQHETHDFELLSQSGTPNYILHTVWRETVTADGTPTVVVESWSMGCKG